ncbi:MAG: hypothetical protein EBZ50_12995, partial [Alphaproteobacteria bacterium]|nr:hypothetical protein [Alphaproteobacteria bacterium]
MSGRKRLAAGGQIAIGLCKTDDPASLNRRLPMLIGIQFKGAVMVRKFCFLLALLLCAWSHAAIAKSADLVIVNAAIKTMDPARPKASAVAIAGETIVFVGNDRGARALIGPATRVIDAEKRTVTPGFIDTHMHPRPVFEEMGPFGQLDLTPEGGVTSREKLLAKVAAKAAVTQPGSP